MSLRQKVADFGQSVRRWGQSFTKGLQIFYALQSLPSSLTSSRSNGLSSNVLMSPVMWVMRAFTEAQLVVQRRRQDSGGGIIWDRVIDHDVEMLIDRPNDAYDGDALWKGTALSYTIDGNAYWRKIRNSFGDVIQLWYVPHWQIKPVWPHDGRTFISHYEIQGGVAGSEKMLPRDIVHFRFGLDPENPRLGYSPLKAVLSEVLTDDEASRFSQKILENMGVPGLVVSPKEGGTAKPEEVKRLETYFEQAFRGDRRGMALVMGKPTEVAQFGFDPNKLMLANLRDISEERVCAAIGVPAAVVGFGSGLQSTKVGATMRELVKLAWVQCVTPMQTVLGRQLTAQLLPDFVAPSFARVFRARFDTSEVSAFQEEAKAEAERVALLVREGILRVDRAQHILGLEVDPKREIYLKNDATDGDSTVHVEGHPNEPPMAQESRDETEPEDDEQKMLTAVARRVGILANGNGTH